jgi:hypothetical protein
MEHIHPIQWILLIGMVAALVYYKKKMAPPKDPPTLGYGASRPAVSQKAKPEKPQKPEESAETIYKELRKKALETTRSRLALPEGFPEDAPHGLLMEMAMPGSSVVTLACFATGDASVYYRTGGGMVGGIGHENVRNIAREFVDQARTVLPRMIQPNGYPLPGNDRIRFYALTAKGPYTVEADRETLADPESDLAPLYYTGQEVVSQMRQVQEQKSQASAGPAIPVGG